MNDAEAIELVEDVLEREVNEIALGKMVVPTKPEIERLEGRTLNRSGWYRAGGGVVCSKCNNKYADHPRTQGYNHLRRICNGDFVKL